MSVAGPRKAACAYCCPTYRSARGLSETKSGRGLEERHCLPEFATWRSLAKCYRDHLALEAVETPDCASGYLASIEQLEATGSRAHLGMLFGLLAGQFLRLGLLNDAAKLLTMAIADGIEQAIGGITANSIACEPRYRLRHSISGPPKLASATRLCSHASMALAGSSYVR